MPLHFQNIVMLERSGNVPLYSEPSPDVGRKAWILQNHFLPSVYCDQVSNSYPFPTNLTRHVVGVFGVQEMWSSPPRRVGFAATCGSIPRTQLATLAFPEIPLASRAPLMLSNRVRYLICRPFIWLQYPCSGSAVLRDYFLLGKSRVF